MTARQGWFADVDPEYKGDKHQWQPVLQTAGQCLSFESWHKTEAECVDFIERFILGQGLLDTP